MEEAKASDMGMPARLDLPPLSDPGGTRLGASETDYSDGIRTKAEGLSPRGQNLRRFRPPTHPAGVGEGGGVEAHILRRWVICKKGKYRLSESLDRVRLSTIKATDAYCCFRAELHVQAQNLATELVQTCVHGATWIMRASIAASGEMPTHMLGSYIFSQ